MKRRTFIKEIILLSTAPAIVRPSLAAFMPFNPPPPLGPPPTTETAWMTSFTPSSPFDGVNTEYGREFTIGAAPVVVSSLGCWTYGTGTRVHTLRLWRDSDSSLIASVAIPFTGLPTGLTYASITPVTLLASGAYRISISAIVSGDNIPQFGSPDTFTSVATDVTGCFSTTVGTFPGSNLGQEAVGGVTFKYTSP